MEQTGHAHASRSAAVGDPFRATASFHPARPGRAVVLQRLVDGAWTEVAAGTEGSTGRVSWHPVAPAGSSARYRAVAQSSKGAADVTTTTRRLVMASAQQGTWSTVTGSRPTSGSLADVSCASSTFCAAVDTAGGALTYDGDTWSRPSVLTRYGDEEFRSVSCPSSTFCLAEGSGTTATWNGTTWARAPGPDLDGNSTVRAPPPTSA